VELKKESSWGGSGRNCWGKDKEVEWEKGLQDKQENVGKEKRKQRREGRELRKEMSRL